MSSSTSAERAREFVGRVRVAAPFPVVQVPTQVKKHGHQFYVPLLKSLVEQLGLEVGDPVVLVFPFPSAEGGGEQ